MSGQRKARPSCDAFLSARNQWAVPFTDVQGHIENTIKLSETFDIQKEFIPHFLKTKYELNIE